MTDTADSLQVVAEALENRIKTAPDLLSSEDKETRHRAFAAFTKAQIDRDLYIPEEIEAATETQIPTGDLQPLKATVQWLRQFIMRPHPNLGRSGAVCPFVKIALGEMLLYLTVARPESPLSHKDIMDEMVRYREVFLKMEPFAGPTEALKCIMILFPQTPEAVFDNAHELMTLKTDMLNHGIMIGQFFPTERQDVLLKSKFFPVQPPTSFYVMRGFLESDWTFLKREKRWRDIYRKKFGSTPED